MVAPLAVFASLLFVAMVFAAGMKVSGVLVVSWWVISSPLWLPSVLLIAALVVAVVCDENVWKRS